MIYHNKAKRVAGKIASSWWVGKGGQAKDVENRGKHLWTKGNG